MKPGLGDIALWGCVAIIMAFGLIPSVRAEEAWFFRIFGPVATTITAFSPDGTMVWTNESTDATFTVQMATSLGSVSNWVDYVQILTTNSVNTNRLIDPNPPSGMVFIPAGSFTMGDSLDGYELPLRSVHVSAFYMDRYDVTKGLWDEVYNWATNHGYNFDHPGSWYSGVNYSKGQDHPVHSINWYDCVKWCNARSEKEYRTQAYYTSTGLTNVYRSGRTNVQNDWVNWSSGYRLPTEAEWEKAARGGASGHRFPWSDNDNITHIRANYFSSTSYAYDSSTTQGYHPSFNDGVYPYTSPVGYFAPNRYGLYDMAGSVWQWCWDWWELHPSGSQSDPHGPPSTGVRMVRGGGWDERAFYCRAAYRRGTTPTYWFHDGGFRSVLAAGQ